MVLIALLLFFSFTPVSAQPLDYCTKNRQTTVERTICADPQLRERETALDELYRQAKASVSDRNELAIERANEIKWREKNCVDRESLVQWFDRRDRSLQSAMAEAEKARLEAEVQKTQERNRHRTLLLILGSGVGTLLLAGGFFLRKIRRRRLVKK